MNFNQWNFGGPKWKVALLVGFFAFFVAATPTLAEWSDTAILPYLARHNIFGMTSDLVDRTGGMVEDTKKLEKEVARAEEALEGLKRQNELLGEQIRTNENIKKELDNQLAGNVGNHKLMREILNREEQTARLTEQTAVRAERVKEQLTDIVGQLSIFAEYTGKVANTTAKMNNRMDMLLEELDSSVNNFRFFAFIKNSFNTVINILDETLQNTVGRIFSITEYPGESGEDSGTDPLKEKDSLEEKSPGEKTLKKDSSEEKPPKEELSEENSSEEKDETMPPEKDSEQEESTREDEKTEDESLNPPDSLQP